MRLIVDDGRGALRRPFFFSCKHRTDRSPMPGKLKPQTRTTAHNVLPMSQEQSVTYVSGPDRKETTEFLVNCE